jgi:hypothetical protein
MLVKWFLYTVTSYTFSRSCDHPQGGNTKDKKDKDNTIIDITEPIQDIK